MPLKERCLRIPYGLEDKAMDHLTDGIFITVTVDCNWCFSDPGGCFPVYPALNSLPPSGPYTGGQIFGPCIPTTAGTVYFNSSLGSDPCQTSIEDDPEFVTSPPHTIIVS
jgi:hypothetical protein